MFVTARLFVLVQWSHRCAACRKQFGASLAVKTQNVNTQTRYIFRFRVTSAFWGCNYLWSDLTNELLEIHLEIRGGKRPLVTPGLGWESSCFYLLVGLFNRGSAHLIKHCCKCPRVSQEAIFHLKSLDRCYKVILKTEYTKGNVFSMQNKNKILLGYPYIHLQVLFFKFK